MEKNQKRLIAIVLCIIGIVGTIMAGKDAAAKKADQSGQTPQTPSMVQEEMMRP